MDAATVTAISTVALAVVTTVYVIVTNGILRSHSEPRLALGVKRSPYYTESMQDNVYLVLRNVGNAPAKDIRLKPEYGVEIGITSYGKNKAAELALTKGIPVLVPGETVGVAWTIRENIDDERIYNFTIEYRRMNAGETSEPESVECPVHVDVRASDPHGDLLQLAWEIKREIEGIKDELRSQGRIGG